MNRYSDFYLNDVRLIMLTRYTYTNLNSINSIRKINLGLNVNNNENISASLSALSILSQQGARSIIKNSSSQNYKTKKDYFLLKYSLYNKNLFYFLENLINSYAPRIRYFKGFPLENFNLKGNYSLAFKDLLIFPELEEELELFYTLSNLRLEFITENNEVGSSFLFSLFNFPFEIKN